MKHVTLTLTAELVTALDRYAAERSDAKDLVDSGLRLNRSAAARQLLTRALSDLR